MGLRAARTYEASALCTPSVDVREAAYAAATIELFSRLWDELEKLNLTARSSGASVRTETRVLAIRLELHLLLQTCDSSRWRAILAPRQQAELRSGLDRVLSAVAVLPVQEALLAQAQNVLLDAVLDLCRRQPAQYPQRHRGKAQLPVADAAWS